jgi:hypothetical protein
MSLPKVRVVRREKQRTRIIAQRRDKPSGRGKRYPKGERRENRKNRLTTSLMDVNIDDGSCSNE